MNEIIAGDFVQMRRNGTTVVGLVRKVESGQAFVSWHGGDEMLDETLPTSELLIVGEHVYLPPSLVIFREELFPRTTFRTRRE